MLGIDLEKILQELLDSVRARKEIAPLREKNSALEVEVADLQKKLSDADKKISKLQLREQELSTQCDTLKNNFDATERILRETKLQLTEKISELAETESKLADAQEIVENFQQNYSAVDAAYKNFLSLDAEIKSSLKNIFPADSGAFGFFVGALQENHLDSLWDFTKNILNNQQVAAPDAEKLCKLFDFCFEAVKIGAGEPFKRIETESGMEFNSSSMIRTNYSHQVGVVSRVLLAGYAYRVSGKIIRASLVEIL